MPSISGTEDPSITIANAFVVLIRAVPEIDAAHVHFSLAYDIVDAEMPCASVEIGADVALDPDGAWLSAGTDSELMIYVDLYDRKLDADAMIRIALQRAYVHKAVMANDSKLGLNDVIQTKYQGAEVPAADPESGVPGWTMRIPFAVHYRFDQADRSIFS